MEVTIVAAQLVDWLAGLPVGRQALVSEVPRKEIHKYKTLGPYTIFLKT